MCLSQGRTWITINIHQFIYVQWFEERWLSTLLILQVSLYLIAEDYSDMCLSVSLTTVAK
jgi:hypothetical protein